MIIKLPYMSEAFFIYVNPEQVSSFQSAASDRSYLWLIHDETQYEICLPVDELEQRLSNAMLDTRNMNVHADYASMLVQLNYLQRLHGIEHSITYFEIVAAIVVIVLIAISFRI